MQFRLLAIALFNASVVFTVNAQSAADQTELTFAQEGNSVEPTAAEIRLAGFEHRRSLEVNSLVANVGFRSVGPTVMSGRVADVDVSPEDPTHFYVAYASGGLWKTTSNGTVFKPLFDDLSSMTIGDIAVDWTDSEGDGETIWVGTGENNSSRSSYAGTGIYKSEDGGATWIHMGLPETHHIGRIVLHPTDENTLWVASIGHLYSPNAERGVYKTTDGGVTWHKTLFIDEDTGVIDLVSNPANPDVLYAASWTRTRRAWNFVEGGSGSAIHKSVDGGETWSRITTEESGFPAHDLVGRIGLAVYPGDPDLIWAIVDNQERQPEDLDEDEPVLTRDALREMSVAEFLEADDEEITAFLDNNGFPLNYDAAGIKSQMREGILEPISLVEYLEDANSQLFDTPVIGAEVYHSSDGGSTWTRTHDDFLDGLVYSYGYYFGQVRVAPDNPDRLYILGVPLLASSDGGATWEAIDQPHVHVDHHALYVNPNRAGHLINGNDGGINISYDDGESWIKANIPPVGQFYAVAFDMVEPYTIYGGLQDNGVWAGSSTSEPDPSWIAEGEYPYERLLGGDGMQIEIDPRDNQTVFTGFQFGNYFRINRSEGEFERITPRHELGERPLRFNWQTPIHLSRHNPDILYFGSNKLHRSLDQGDTWETLSEDLTLGGKPGDVPYGTLTSIDESPLKFGLLWTGSDDGLIHVSRDAGYTFENVSNGLAADYWVSRVEASHHEASRAYAALNGYRWDNFEAHIYATDDMGSTWRRIGGNLPQEPVNVIVEDPENEDLLYVGTDHGVYVSFDRGESFMSMSGYFTGEEVLPNVPVHDLKVHPRDSELIVGTHGRSIYVANVAHMQQLSDEIRSNPLHIFELSDARYSTRWGSRNFTWSDMYEPSVEVSYWSNEDREVTIGFYSEQDELVYEFSDSAESGLNFADYHLVSSAPLSEEHEPGEDNGVFYLIPGEYTIAIASPEQRVETRLVVAEPPPQPPRGRKKTP